MDVPTLRRCSNAMWSPDESASNHSQLSDSDWSTGTEASEGDRGDEKVNEGAGPGRATGPGPEQGPGRATGPGPEQGSEQVPGPEQGPEQGPLEQAAAEEQGQQGEEPLLCDDGPQKYVIYPIGEERQETWDWYKKSQALIWTAEELDLIPDVKAFDELEPQVKYYLAVTLAFFAASDGIVNENIVVNFMTEVQCPAARCFYGFQIAIENVHSEVYSLLIDSLIKKPFTVRVDGTERRIDQATLFDGIENFASIRAKTEWALRWLNEDRCSFAERLVAFACVEGIFFSSSFCSIFWLKTRHYQLTGLFTSNEFISRDEGLHRDFACFLYTKRLRRRLAPARVQRIVREAVDTEMDFVRELLPVRLIGMNEDLMIQYVQYVADHLLVHLDCEKLYHVPNPFDFMESLSIEGKTNFFEQRVSEYSKAGVGVAAEQQAARVFSVDEEF